ncbi:hypothetical protein [Methylocaldum sp.]|uniref:hypothetical protein n=1 Tax=Methylocaldum sp. TaxID=1969727 RepID=UPI002D6BD00A|nr:hypothetical protein [Methylocaldum sp.]HYE38130.1 hypothetical protein [Methylocaldum sp.]
MTKKCVIIALMALFTLPVYAGNDRDDCPGNSCHGGQGGQGGDGGAGGDANSLGIGIGVGGSANATGGDATAIGLGGKGGDASAISVGVGGEGGKSSSDADASAKAGANAGSSSGGNSLTVNEGDYEARAIPVGSSIAAGANGTSKCLKHASTSGNLFFVSFARASHEPDYMCWAQELGAPEVAIQMACNDSGSFRKAYNQIARRHGKEECLSE